jgi:ribonuclease HI
MYTDGGCRDKIGGWAYVISEDGKSVWKKDSGGERNTTNNKMELTAILNGLMNFDFGDAIQSRLSNEDDEEIFELVRETISTDIQERKHYLNIKKIMLETIFDQYEEEKQEQKGEKGEKGIIIHGDFSRGMK